MCAWCVYIIYLISVFQYLNTHAFCSLVAYSKNEYDYFLLLLFSHFISMANLEFDTLLACVWYLRVQLSSECFQKYFLWYLIVWKQ